MIMPMKLLPDLWTGHPNYHSIQSLRHSRCLGYRYNQRPSFPVASDFVLCTDFESPTFNYRHYVSFILSVSTGSPGLKANLLGQIPGLPGRRNSDQPGFTQLGRSTRALRTYLSPLLRFWQLPIPIVPHVTIGCPRYLLVFRMRYA